MTNINPYNSPSSNVDAVGPKVTPKYTRLATWLAILMSGVPLFAWWGYPNLMTPFWIYYLMPSLAVLTIALTSIALGRRKLSASGFSVVPAFVTCSIVALFAASISTPLIATWDLRPRLLAAVAGLIAALIYTLVLHGNTSGRRGLILGNGLAILQAATSIGDILSHALWG